MTQATEECTSCDGHGYHRGVELCPSCRGVGRQPIPSAHVDEVRLTPISGPYHLTTLEHDAATAALAVHIDGSLSLSVAVRNESDARGLPPLSRGAVFESAVHERHRIQDRRDAAARRSRAG